MSLTISEQWLISNPTPQFWPSKFFSLKLGFGLSCGWCPFIEFWLDLLGKKGHGTVEFHRYIVKSQITMKKISKCNEYENNDLLCLPAVWLSSVTSGARGVGMSP